VVESIEVDRAGPLGGWRRHPGPAPPWRVRQQYQREQAWPLPVTVSQMLLRKVRDGGIAAQSQGPVGIGDQRTDASRLVRSRRRPVPSGARTPARNRRRSSATPWGARLPARNAQTGALGAEPRPRTRHSDGSAGLSKVGPGQDPPRRIAHHGMERSVSDGRRPNASE
jgi:hypothetical protein